ncbi:MAG: YlxM family DNA-binding protein [Clostridia bacterium]|nr:YlxM family DNA-binding protein [Clostridia bacterium]MBR5016033.1 YlxM family DNA-binding protein [Clostridia bacterium]MBR6479758.1 YlxM family DNA-binding protein [Clostridia bacterium]MBR6513143.1 YlxM family DNA-binding protein [Clostridia bacterium]
MAKNFEVINILLDFYGDMLTDKQRAFIEYYYNDDLSLSEIAENEGITRQGVRDAIKRAEAQLFEMEERLGLAKRFEEVRAGLDEILECAEVINESNMRTGLSRDINEAVVKIKLIAQTLNNEEA